MGASAVQPLIDALKVSEDGFRKKAAEILGQIGDTRAVEPLLVLMELGTSPAYTAVRQALSNLGWKPRMDESVVKAVQQGDLNLVPAS